MQNQNKQGPIYEPPDDRQIERYARAVCERFAQQQNDETLCSSEIVNGFATFLKVLMRIEAKHRNGVA